VLKLLFDFRSVLRRPGDEAGFVLRSRTAVPPLEFEWDRIELHSRCRMGSDRGKLYISIL
jgi:hypothetical protein